jgi:hypothetical protein
MATYRFKSSSSSWCTRLAGIVLMVMLAGAATASAETIILELSDFVIFSGGGGLPPDGSYETSIGGHTAIDGNIGSNQDLFLQGNPLPGYPAQLNGSAYAGGDLTFGQDLTVGSVTESREVVVNGAAAIGGSATIFGTLDALSYTLGSGAVVTGGATANSDRVFGLITMPAPTDLTGFNPTQGDQTIPGNGGTLTLAPNTLATAYGDVVADNQNETLILSSGEYYMGFLSAAGGFTLQIDLTSGDPIEIYVLGDVDFTAQGLSLEVKGAGTGGAFVPLADVPDLATLIYMETQGDFDLGGENAWGGTLYASLGSVNIGQYINWHGAAYAYDSVVVADHGTWNYVPEDMSPVEPASWGRIKSLYRR